MSIAMNYCEIDAKNLCTRILKAYISTDPARVDQYIAKVSNEMREECDGLSTKDRTLQYLFICIDGLRYGNWPKELV